MNVPAYRRHNSSRSLVTAALFVVAVVGTGLLIGYLTRPGEWYESLAKPAFNPPPWVFGPVWTVLYVMIALAGFRISRASPGSAAMRWWFAQMALNWLWSPAFFGAEMPWLALAIIVALLAGIAVFIAKAWELDRPAAWLFVPYAAWVAFATALNGSIAVLN
jgi:tryptophan-rich sensory protein